MAASRNNATVKVSSIFPVLDTRTAECDRHGEYKSENFRLPGAGPRWSDCPACVQETIDREDKEIADQARHARKKAILEATLDRAAIPKRFLNRTLENYRAENDGQKRALSSVRKYLESWEENRANGTSIIMCGNPGTGKTHLAIGLASALMKMNQTVLFARLIEIVRAIKETYATVSYDDNGNAKTRKLTEREVLARFSTPDLLIIDEVGRQHGTDFERMMLFEVIQSRYEESLPTIIITNKTKEGLMEYMDEAAIDRLREGGGRAIVFDWESERGSL